MELSYTHADIFRLALERLKSQGFHINSTIQQEGSFLLTGCRICRNSGLGFKDSTYYCSEEWPLECGIQCGDSGIVMSQNGNYNTAFFEAFPKDPKCFLRGEGETVEKAEEACWKAYQGILNCIGHEFERRNREDGYAFCKHCALSGVFLPPLHPCTGCGAVDYKSYGEDNKNRRYCEPCYEAMPRELWTDWRIKFAKEDAIQP
jgi:hypothetical protein